MQPGLTQDQRERVADQERLLAKARKLRPVAAIPYHAHLRIETDAGIRDLLLADGTQRSDGATLIDWRSAPLAEVFFTARPGEDYEIETDGRVLTGRVLQRNLVHFDGGALVGIDTGVDLLRRVPGQPWGSAASPGRAFGLTVVQRSPVPSRDQLDPQQRRALEIPLSEPVLIYGPAGSGKTTAALHRLAHALQQRGGRRSALRALAVAPTEGLRRLLRAKLDALGLGQVEAVDYEHWAMERARRFFPGLPGKISQDTPAGVLRFKRHPALRAAITRLADLQSAGPTRRADLQELFGDRALLQAALETAPGDLYPGLIDQAREHTRIQFAKPSEQRYGHVLAEHLATLDGRSIDAGTPMADARSADAEDAAVLFELERCRAEVTGRKPRRPDRVDVLLVDEIQEFAPLELALLGRAVAPGGSVIAAGDADQQIDPGSGFTGFDDSLAELGTNAAHRIQLTDSHRCPPGILALARQILTGDHPENLPADEGLRARRDPSACHQIAWLGEALVEATGRLPALRVAVICRTPQAARLVAGQLSPMLGVRLALGVELATGAGVFVTCVAAVRGLEFDLVVLPDPTAEAYPDSAQARRALYVAMTRTSSGLCLASDADWSPLLLPACSRASWE